MMVSVEAFLVGRSLRAARITAALGALVLAACKGGETDGPASNVMSATNPSGSKCGSVPAQLVDFNTLAAEAGGGIGAMQVAVDATNIYFVFANALMRVPIRGGPVSSMLPHLPNVVQNWDPVATPTRVLLHHVVGDGTNEQVVSVPIQSGQETILATSSGSVVGLAADGDDVYFVDSAGLKSVPATGGGVQLLSNLIGSQPTGLAVVGPNLVVTAGGAVVSVPIGGGPPTTLASQQPNAEFPMPCGPDTCWWTGAPPSPMGPTGPGYIARLHAGSVTTISAPVYPWSLAFDGSNFFETVGCDLCSGTLVRMAPAGTPPPVTMISASFVAVDDECAYFSVVEGFDLPSDGRSGLPGTGIYSVAKSYAEPALSDR
jgi:hypothetical protein